MTVLAPPDGSEGQLARDGLPFPASPRGPGGLNPMRDLALLRTMHKIFAREQPDVVLGYTIKNNLYGALAAKRLGIPFIPNVTGLGTAFLSNGALQRIAEQLYRAAFRSLPVVFFQNEDDAELFRKRRLVRDRPGARASRIGCRPRPLCPSRISAGKRAANVPDDRAPAPQQGGRRIRRGSKDGSGACSRRAVPVDRGGRCRKSNRDLDQCRCVNGSDRTG